MKKSNIILQNLVEEVFQNTENILEKLNNKTDVDEVKKNEYEKEIEYLSEKNKVLIDNSKLLIFLCDNIKNIFTKNGLEYKFYKINENIDWLGHKQHKYVIEVFKNDMLYYTNSIKIDYEDLNKDLENERWQLIIEFLAQGVNCRIEVFDNNTVLM